MKVLSEYNKSHLAAKKDNIKLPLNLKNSDRNHFQKDQTWEYKEPDLVSCRFVIGYPKGFCTDLFFNPIENLAPWKGFYKAFTRNYFIGEFARSIRKTSLQFVANPGLYYCINDFSDNYFHWFTEVLPKMLYVKKKDAAAVFFVPFKLKSYQVISLNICNISVVTTDRKIAVFRKVIVVGNATIYPGIYHPVLVNMVRENFKNATKPANGLEKKNSKIYITRRSAERRRLLNEEEILPILLEYGFEVFDFDHVSFSEQLAITSRADMLMSIHGAALTNMFFLPPGAAVIEMLPVDVHNDKCYFTLAGTLNLRYYYIDCEINGTNHVTADFTVDKEKFENKILGIITR